jgi:tetratricopeptide (TPR) repeat protein
MTGSQHAATPAAIWSKAAQLIEAGRAEEADAELRRALRRLGPEPELIQLRGVALLRLKRPRDALPLLQKAAAALPARPDIGLNLGTAFLDLDRPREAVGPLGRSAAAFPSVWELAYLLGLAHERIGDAPAAVAGFAHALALNPSLWDARLRLMTLFRVMERYGEAIAVARAALAERPDEAAVRHDLAMLLAISGDPQSALAEVDGLLARQPLFLEALNTRGNVLGDLKRPLEARTCFRKALVLEPAYADAHYNFANIDRLEEIYAPAIGRYGRTLAIAPGFLMARNNLAAACLAAGEVDAAVSHYGACVSAAPDWAEPAFNLGLALLLKGDARGLDGYEARWRVKGLAESRRVFRQPDWDGSSFAGRRLLLHPEQGDGDTIQFIRYLPQICARGGEVLLECPPRLTRLLGTLSGGATLLRPDVTPPPFDLQLPLGSLMRVFATEVATIPDNVPYLLADRGLRESWRARLGVAGFKVGLTWQGNPAQGSEPHRSIALSLLHPLLGVAGCRFFAVQKEFGREQMAGLPPGLLDDLGPGLGDYADTAAAISELDLVITTCTSVAHLAGALGKPVWILLRRVPDWRWLLDRDDSPWYPSARLFRQRRPGDWSEVVERVAQALEMAARERQA